MTDNDTGKDQSGSEQPTSGQPAGELPAGSGTEAPPPPSEAHRAPFPAIRLLYAFGFGIVAWFVFWILIILALAQFIVVAINGRVNDELKHFSQNLVQYLQELLGFICFARDEQPFPIGPFPKQA